MGGRCTDCGSDRALDARFERFRDQPLTAPLAYLTFPSAGPRSRHLRTVLTAFVLFGLLAGHLAAARGLLRSYPFSYSWTELLIDYRGGFSKRGLLGEIAFQLQSIVAARDLIVAAVAGGYFVAVLGEVLVLRLPDEYAGLLFLLSPAGGLFPLLNPQGYGRKDAFVLAALVSGMAVAARCRRRSVVLLAPMAVFAVAGLLVEVAWFYYPLVAAATLALRRDEPARWRLGAAATATAYTAACLALTLAAPHVDTDAIARSWDHTPFATDSTGALCCLNFHLADAVGVARATLPNLGGYALGLAAGLLPLALLLLRRPPRRADVLTHGAALFGIVFAMAPVFIAADWGRYIALWLTATFLYAWTVARAQDPRPAARPGAEGLLIRAALLIVYAGTWKVAYYQTPDRSAFMPGAVFEAFRSAPPPHEP